MLGFHRADDFFSEKEIVIHRVPSFSLHEPGQALAFLELLLPPLDLTQLVLSIIIHFLPFFSLLQKKNVVLLLSLRTSFLSLRFVLVATF